MKSLITFVWTLIFIGLFILAFETVLNLIDFLKLWGLK
jgi:hypothetical protein